MEEKIDRVAGLKPLYIDLLVLLAANIAFFYHLLFIEHLYYADGETLANFYPLYHFIGESYRNLVLPLWDPYYYFPILGVNFAGVFYPPNILVSMLISSVDLNTGFFLLSLAEVAHYFAASVFMYLLMRRLGAARSAAVLAGILYAYSGYSVKSMQQPCIINTLTWFPLLFYFYLRALKEGYSRAVMAGCVLGVCFLAGYLNLTIYSFILLSFFALYTAWKERSAKRSIAENLRPLLLLVTVFIVGFLLAAPQNLATLEYAYLSIRHVGQSYISLTALGSIPPLQFLSLLVPQLYGATDIPQWISDQVYVGYWEIVYYAGVLPLLLALIAVLFRRDRVTLFFGVVFIAAIFVAMGKNAAPAGWLYFIPFFPFSRVPARFTFLMDFSIAMLAGLGFDWLIRNSRASLRALKPVVYSIGALAALSLLICVALYFLSSSGNEQVDIRLHNAFNAVVKLTITLVISTAFVYILGWKSRGRIVVSLIVIFVVADLYHFTGTLNPVTHGFYNPDTSIRQKPVLRFVREKEGLFRTSGLTYPAFLGHINKLYNLGYTGGFSHLDFTRFRGMNSPWGQGGHAWSDLRPDHNSEFSDFYNVKYFISEEDLSLKSDKYKKVWESGSTKVFENLRVYPRAFVVGNHVVETDRDRVLERMGEVDLRETVVLDGPVSVENKSRTTGGNAEITKYAANSVRIKTEGGGGFLVMSDLFYPGWKAYMDGERAEVLRANYTFRAVRLPAGAHTVEFVYSPRSFVVGVWLSVLTALSLLALWLIRRRKAA
jgi:hypothetical protein